MKRRGEIWWADLDPAPGETVGRRRPVLIVSADEFNASMMPTVVAVAISSDIRLVPAPGNVALDARDSGLRRDAVIDVASLMTLKRGSLTGPVAEVSAVVMRGVDEGLRLALGLPLRPGSTPAPVGNEVTVAAEQAPRAAPTTPRVSTGFVRSTRPSRR